MPLVMSDLEGALIKEEENHQRTLRFP
jgi:hypothetical protein